MGAPPREPALPATSIPRHALDARDGDHPAVPPAGGSHQAAARGIRVAGLDSVRPFELAQQPVVALDDARLRHEALAGRFPDGDPGLPGAHQRGEGRVFQGDSRERGHVPRRRVVERLIQSVRIAEAAVGHADVSGLLIHQGHKTAEAAADVLGCRHCGVIGGTDENRRQEVSQRDALAGAQAEAISARPGRSRTCRHRVRQLSVFQNDQCREDLGHARRRTGRVRGPLVQDGAGVRIHEDGRRRAQAEDVRVAGAAGARQRQRLHERLGPQAPSRCTGNSFGRRRTLSVDSRSRPPRRRHIDNSENQESQHRPRHEPPNH
ncbi:MAG: hypothetical protein H6Q86_1900 [candidate division NC10 bacterium]|nr:hypothetical protein [candidate division NC10 bacterium]